MTSGTREWCKYNKNCQKGCEYNCPYCYAKGMAIRFERIDNKDDWKLPVINQKAINKNYGKYNGCIMFPSTHDITPNNVNDCLIVLKKLLEKGNELLIVSKPSISVFKKIRKHLSKYKRQITFRFTITTMDVRTQKIFEPNAPSPQERIKVLMDADEDGWRTTVSIEPYLDYYRQLKVLIQTVMLNASEIWLGPMNKKYCPPELWNDFLWSKEAINEIHQKMIKDGFRNHNFRVLIKLKDSFRKALILDQDNKKDQNKKSIKSFLT